MTCTNEFNICNHLIKNLFEPASTLLYKAREEKLPETTKIFSESNFLSVKTKKNSGILELASLQYKFLAVKEASFAGNVYWIEGVGKRVTEDKRKKKREQGQTHFIIANNTNCLSRSLHEVFTHTQSKYYWTFKII